MGGNLGAPNADMAAAAWLGQRRSAFSGDTRIRGLGLSPDLHPRGQSRGRGAGGRSKKSGKQWLIPRASCYGFSHSVCSVELAPGRQWRAGRGEAPAGGGLRDGAPHKAPATPALRTLARCPSARGHSGAQVRRKQPPPPGHLCPRLGTKPGGSWAGNTSRSHYPTVACPWLLVPLVSPSPCA